MNPARWPRRALAALELARSRMGSIAARVAIGLAILVLALWWRDAYFGLAQAPGKLRLDLMEIYLAQGKHIELGWSELGQSPGSRSAEARHVRLSREPAAQCSDAGDDEAAGDVLCIANVASSRQLELDYVRKNERFAVLADSFPVPLGQSALIALQGGVKLTLDYSEASSGKLSLSRADGRDYAFAVGAIRGKTWRGNAAAAMADPDEICDPPSPADHIRGFVEATGIRGLLKSLLAGGGYPQPETIGTLGGASNCLSGRPPQFGGFGVGDAAFPWRSLRISVGAGAAFVSAYEPARRDAVAVAFRRNGPSAAGRWTSFAERKWRVAGGEWGSLRQVIIGSTRYEVVPPKPSSGEAPALSLRPVGKVALFDRARCADEGSRAHCPHPLDWPCGDAACSPETLAEVAGAPICYSPKPGDDKGAGGKICWTWKLVNPLEDTDALREMRKSGSVSMIRALFTTLAIGLAALFSGGGYFVGWLIATGLAEAAIYKGLFSALGIGAAEGRIFAPLLAGVGLIAIVGLRWRGGLPLALTLLSCAIALAGEIQTAIGSPLSPSAAFDWMLWNWLAAGAALLGCEAGISLGLFWLAITALSALGTLSLALMTLDGSSTNWLDMSLKHRMMFLELIPPLTVALAKAPPNALRRFLERFAATDPMEVQMLPRAVAAPLRIARATLAFVVRAARDLRQGKLRSRPRATLQRALGLPRRLIVATRARGLGDNLRDAWVALAGGVDALAAASSRLGFFALRWSVGGGLVALMLIWFSTGSQIGIGEFQPVEFAKFALVVVCARALMTTLGALTGEEGGPARDESLARALLDVAAHAVVIAGIAAIAAAVALPGLSLEIRAAAGSAGPALATIASLYLVQRGERGGLVELLADFFILVFFVVVMIGVPSMLSDWSPALIMGVVFVAMVVVFFIMLAVQTVAATNARERDRALAPRPFKVFPPGRYRGLKGLGICAAVIVAGLGFADLKYHFNVLRPFASTYALATKIERWRDNRGERLDALENEGLPAGRRVVVERFVTWEDMAFDNAGPWRCPRAGSATNTPPRPCYIDTEMQVLLSRRVVAEAPCGFADAIARPLPWIGGITAAATPRAWRCESGAAAVPLEPANTNLRAVEPIEVPVVESDFAGAFLIGRLGVGAALTAFAAQLLFIAIPIHTIFALARAGTDFEGRRRATARLLAVVTAGCASLFVMQWALAWANVLGLAPVMGQPMTWLANASSHHALMALPCVMTFIAAARFARFPVFQFRPRDPPI